MSCNREGCNSIMCDCYISGLGYICNECINEFKGFSGDFDSEDSLLESLSGFMDMRKRNVKNWIDKNEFFNKHTG